MEIIVKKTTELTSEEWETYIHSFNTIFHKTLDVDHFKHKYFNTIDGFSYHSLLIENKSVVGSCTIIPYEYYIESKTIRVGLAVDVFISEDYREDPYSLFRMYKKLKKDLLLNDISLVIAVPNDTAYPYWKNIVKWKDVGFLEYHALPVRLGNTIHKWQNILNPLSYLGTRILLLVTSGIQSTEKRIPIRMNKSNSIIEKQRYTADHKKIRNQNISFSYRLVNEEGTIVCYLIDFYQIKKNIKDTFSLRKAIDYITKNEKIDLILYVGKLSFFQFLLFKVPFKKEPKHLYFMADLINPENIHNPEFIYRMDNWDFGLFNYDVR